MKRLIKWVSMIFFHPYLSMCNVGKNILVGRKATIRKAKQIDFAHNVRIGREVRIQFYNSQARLTLGENVYMVNRNSFLLGGNISIGKDTLMASDILVSSENHGNNPESPLPYGVQELICKDVVIGNGCWIGEKVIILPGVTVGDRTIIGAGSIVTKSLPPYCIAAGNPAKVIKQYDFKLHKWVATKG